MRPIVLLAMTAMMLAGCGSSSSEDTKTSAPRAQQEASTTTPEAATTPSPSTSTTSPTTTTTTAAAAGVPPTTSAPATPPRWATADETVAGLLEYWKAGRLDELKHLHEAGGGGAADQGLRDIPGTDLDISSPQPCAEFESKVGGLEAVCDLRLARPGGGDESVTLYLAPAPEGGYWLLRYSEYHGSYMGEGGM